MLLCLTLISSLFFIDKLSAFWKQSIQVKGIFTCGEEIPRNATIELWEEDFPLLNSIFQYLSIESEDSDDKLASVHPNENGAFVINATHEEITALSLYLVVYHQCELINHYNYTLFQKNETESWRRFILRIPQQYATFGDTAKQSFNLGVWNLQSRFLVNALFF
ncbi:unnamed protein product [Thelazia callipaeda]|uniref:Transthyretin-like family protein n=1 Tax=Thelazia callipaeda TaxID=103827 RepID=A0A0N5D1G5_THECL|nr:unnamed protein product [Thelazia callipaeda]